VKLIFIGLAGVNFLWFEVGVMRGAAEWSDRPFPPARVRVAGWTSLALWSVVVISGRLIPYLG
jgi:hypothetical protein